MSDSAKSSPAHSLKNSELFDEVPASPDQTVIAGWLKFRDQKKWKLRWGAVTKLSPAADCLHMQLYRDGKDRYKQGMTKASLSLEHFLGTETGFTLDKESNTAAIICRDVVVTLAFDSRERLIQWQMKINYNLGESTQFLIQISSSPTKAKLNSGPAKMHIQNNSFCLTTGMPPKLIGYWEIKHLRRFGVVDGKFCFEGGSLCGRGEGLYVFLADECDGISSCMQRASQGHLVPNRRYMTRNMLESSRRLSETSSMNLMPSTQISCQSFAMYEWASMDSRSERKVGSDYSFHSQNQNHSEPWSDFGFDKLTKNSNYTNSDGQSETNYEPYDSCKAFCELDSYTNMQQLKDNFEPEDAKKVPERPPKPSKLRPVTANSENSVIKGSPSKSSQPNCQNSFTTFLKQSNDYYDVPKTLCSSTFPKSLKEQTCVVCIEPRTIDEEQTPINNYDVSPKAVPVNTTCSCKSKMSVIIDSEEFHNHKRSSSSTVCPCQHFLTCWPYNWLQIAYCGRGSNIQDTSVPFKMVDHPKTKSEIDCTPLYAKVDLSKKTKNKPLEQTIAAAVPPRPTEPKPKIDSSCSESNNSYTNLYFENTLKYYENARELIRNNLALDEKANRESSTTAVDSCCRKCIRSHMKPDDPENYIIMNPLENKSSTSDSQSGNKTKNFLVTDLPKSMEKFTVSRNRSDSLGSAKSAPSSIRRDEVRVEDEGDKLRCKSKASVNRDSSSSNDSGFSFGSLKSTDVEIPYQPLVMVRNNSFSAGIRPRLSSRSNSLKGTDYFHSAGSSSGPAIHQRTSSRREAGSLRSDATSIPFIDSQSTSSENSDISDYIETLSLSSHSSSETAAVKVALHHSPSSILRPRSGKEYEKERRNIFKLAGIENDNCTHREAILIEEYLKQRQELEFERSYKIKLDRNAVKIGKFHMRRSPRTITIITTTTTTILKSSSSNFIV